MKKMLLATALACLLQDVLNRRLLFKTNPWQWHKNHHPIISSFLKLGETVGRQNLWRRRKCC